MNETNGRVSFSLTKFYSMADSRYNSIIIIEKRVYFIRNGARSVSINDSSLDCTKSMSAEKLKCFYFLAGCEMLEPGPMR